MAVAIRAMLDFERVKMSPLFKQIEIEQLYHQRFVNRDRRVAIDPLWIWN